MALIIFTTLGDVGLFISLSFPLSNCTEDCSRSISIPSNPYSFIIDFISLTN